VQAAGGLADVLGGDGGDAVDLVAEPHVRQAVAAGVGQVTFVRTSL
jgi:hypothetical protein